jgi:hypothetical protein
VFVVWDLGLGFGVWGLRSRVKGSRARVQGLWFMVSVPEFRVRGLGLAPGQ